MLTGGVIGLALRELVLVALLAPPSDHVHESAFSGTRGRSSPGLRDPPGAIPIIHCM